MSGCPEHTNEKSILGYQLDIFRNPEADTVETKLDKGYIDNAQKINQKRHAQGKRQICQQRRKSILNWPRDRA